MYFKKWFLIVPLALTTLVGCGTINNPFVYRIDVAQGNFVEQEAVSKLRIDMSKEQVRYVLGSPMLVETGFPDTWYYIYSFTEGHEDTVQKQLTVTFDEASGKLVTAEGDFELSPEFNTPLD